MPWRATGEQHATKVHTLTAEAWRVLRSVQNRRENHMQNLQGNPSMQRSCGVASRVIATAAIAMSLATATHATQTITGSNGLEGLGSFTGSMSWTYLGSGTGTLAVSLTNTSNPANGGRLTGFAFNTVNGVNLSLTSAPSASWLGVSNVSASPFPNFDFGAALGGNWLGGGSPNAGIAVGSTGAFSFQVSGNDSLLATLSDASFFDTSNGYGFAARFRGFDDGGSDKVTGELAVVPLPQTLGLACMGLVGLAIWRRRK
jgi:hypothetical protein